MLNILLPNVATALVNAIEDMIYRATKISFNFNGDNDPGGTSTGTYQAQNSQNANDPAHGGVGVDGFTSGNGGNGGNG
ncbi:MAG: hypothetical protein IJ593_05225 [Lachnospiraceae bacterium]|nr:hypothetical protein [Lachnospiraceae bacterium]